MNYTHDCVRDDGVVGSGNLNADVMFCGIAPGRTEMETHRVLSGPSGKFLDAILKFEYVGLNRADVFCTNLICHWNDKPSKAEILECQPRLYEEIRNIKPKIIVALGQIATTALMPWAGKFGNAQGGVWRGTIANHECWFLSTYHPAAYKPVRKDGMEAMTAIRDFRKLREILTWPTNIAEVDYQVANSAGEANDWLRHFAIKHTDDVVAIDVETLYSHKEMISIAFSCSCGTYHVPRLLMTSVNFHILEGAHCRWTYHNGMFDTAMMRLLLGIDLPIVEDTMLMSYSLDERGGRDQEADSAGFRRSVGIHGLKRLSREYFAAGYYDAKTTVTVARKSSKKANTTFVDSLTGDELDAIIINQISPLLPEGYTTNVLLKTTLPNRRKLVKEYLSSSDPKLKVTTTELLSSNPEHANEVELATTTQTPIELLTPEELAEYNSKDAAYTLRLQRRFEPLQQADNVRNMYLSILIPSANMLSEVHDRGAHIDRKLLGELTNEWGADWLRLFDEFQTLSRELGWPQPQLNPDSWPDMHVFVYDIVGMPVVEGQGRTTKREVLEEWAKLPSRFGEWCRVLQAFRGRNKDISTWIEGVGEALDDNDFIHPEPLIHGTSVGRMSYHAPPIQTTGKPRTVGEERARVRRIFSASNPEMVLIEADFSQSELWWAGMVSGDANMIDDLSRCIKCEQIFNPVKPTLCEVDGKPHKADFHRRLAITSFGVDPNELDPTTWDRYRNSAKVFAFGGLLYGGGIDVITGKHYLGKAQPNLYFVRDVKKAAEIYRNAGAKYSRYMEWRNEEKQHVQVEGDQQSMSERKRRYYYITDFKTFNQTINFPVSCVSHDNLLVSMNELHPLLAEYDAYLWWEVHDSIVAEAPRKYLHEVVKLIESVMTRPRFGAPYGVPVEVKCGANWGTLKDYEPNEDYSHE